MRIKLRCCVNFVEVGMMLKENFFLLQNPLKLEKKCEAEEASRSVEDKERFFSL